MTCPIVGILQRYAIPLGIVLAICGAYVYHRVELRDAQRAGYAACRADADDQMRRANEAYRKQEAEEREISRLHDVAHQEAQSALQERVDALTRRNLDLGRLSKRPASCPGAASAAEPAHKFDGQAWDDGHAMQASVPAGSDLGVELVQYGAECESLRLRLRDLQQWVESTR